MRTSTVGAVAAAVLLTGVGAAAAPASAATDRPIKATAVARHASAADCWTIVGRGVYNLTGYVTRHPGGRSEIVRVCGRNGSSAFLGEHSGDADARRALAPFRIGTLAR